MAEQIISASGTQFGLIVNPDGSINTTAGTVSIGSVLTYNPIGIGSVLVTNSLSVSVGSEVYVKSLPIGSNYVLETNPAANNRYNYTTVIVYSGTAAGSIYRETSAGSFVQVITYDANGNATKVSSWSAI